MASGWRDFHIDSDQFPFVRLEKNYVPDEESLEDRKQMFQGNLNSAIKRKLWSGESVDREVREELPEEQYVFDTGLDDIN